LVANTSKYNLNIIYFIVNLSEIQANQTHMEDSNNYSAGTPRAYEYREEAIPLVVFNEEKRCFEINEESREFLKSL
jgi:hypothetical protein